MRTRAIAQLFIDNFFIIISQSYHVRLVAGIGWFTGSVCAQKPCTTQ
jgi:hypothetical protein